MLKLNHNHFTIILFSTVELEPKETVGILATDTEIHVCPPKVAHHVGPIVNPPLVSFKSVLSEILNQHIKKNPPENVLNTVLKLRILPVEDRELFQKNALQNNPEIVMQPYSAFLSIVHREMFKDIQDCIGRIQNEGRISYVSLHFLEDSKILPIHPNAIYLSEVIIRQLKLTLKQRIALNVQIDNPPSRCDGVNFYTFVQVIIFWYI